MIVFELICPRHHRFEGWFASTGDFTGQKDRGLLLCPVCGHSHIEKLPTAKIGKHETELLPAAHEDQAAVPGAPQADVRLQDILNYVLMNTENVGKDFAAEARRIHQENIPGRSIRGTATRKETEELLEEGIPVMSLPIPPQGDWH